MTFQQSITEIPALHTKLEKFKNVVFTLKMHQNDQFSSTTTGEILAGKPHGYRFRKAPFSCQISVDVRPDLRCCVDGA